MQNILKLFLLSSLLVLLASCGSFKAQRVDAATSDEKAMEITDQWVAADTQIAVKNLLEQIQNHRGFKRYLAQLGHTPSLFISEVQNLTGEAYFPINDINDELLNEFSASGDFVLVDAAARNRLLEEITYQNDGMVDAATAKKIGKQIGADLLIFGNIYMQPQSRNGKTIKEYAINLRMTDLEKGVEVLRVRDRSINKYSERSSIGW